MTKFKGFTYKTFDFLRDPEPHKQWISTENENPRIAYPKWQQEWNDKYKTLYENELLNPLTSLAEDLTPLILKIDSDIDQSIENILLGEYKRVTVKGLYYKQQPLKDKYSYPVYCFTLNAEGYEYGVGFTTTDKELMDCFLYGTYKNNEIRVEELISDGFTIDVKIHNKKYREFYVKKAKYMCDELLSSALVPLLQAEFTSLQWLYNLIKDNIEYDSNL